MAGDRKGALRSYKRGLRRFCAASMAFIETELEAGTPFADIALRKVKTRITLEEDF
jgi:hypothetical protein